MKKLMTAAVMLTAIVCANANASMNIPMPGSPGESFLRGMDSGSSMYSGMMQPEMQRQQMAQQQWQFEQEMAFRKQQHRDAIAHQKAQER